MKEAVSEYSLLFLFRHALHGFHSVSFKMMQSNRVESGA